MDIRIGSYQNRILTQTYPAQNLGNTRAPAVATASNAASLPPVAPVAAVSGRVGQLAGVGGGASLGSLLAANPGVSPAGGPGQILDIYA